jgi:fatty acid desaturase
MKSSGALLDSGSLRRFTTLIPGRNLGHVLMDYLGVILLHVAAVWIFENWRDWGWPRWALFPVGTVTVLLTGCMIHRIALIGHEASHYLLLQNRRWNEVVADLLCFFPLWGSLVNYRRKHHGHHLYPNEPGRDPNLGTKEAEKLFASFPMPRPSSIYRYYALFLWPPFVLRNLIQMGRVLGVGAAAPRIVAPEPVKRRSVTPGVLGMFYLLILFASLILVRGSGDRWLLIMVPLGVHAAGVIVWWCLPRSWFERHEGSLGYPKKMAALVRLSMYALILMVTTWIRAFTGLPLGHYYLLFWLIPLLYVFPYLMLLRELYQHANLGTGTLDNSRIIYADPFTRWALLGYGNDFHLIHHIYPNIPHYHLRKVHAELIEKSEAYRRELVEVHGTIHSHGKGRSTLAESWATGAP